MSRKGTQHKGGREGAAERDSTHRGKAERDSTQRHKGTKVRGEGRRYFLAKSAEEERANSLIFLFLTPTPTPTLQSDE